MNDIIDYSDHGGGRWELIPLAHFTLEDHERFAFSLYQVESAMAMSHPKTATDRRRRTMGVQYVQRMRAALCKHYGEVYGDPVADVAVDLDVWGECIAGLDLKGLDNAI